MFLRFVIVGIFLLFCYNFLMTEKLDKVFNPFSLILINFLIIGAAELLGGGLLLYESGAIHAIALFFIGLSLTRVFLHYYSYDQFLEKFLHATLAALFVFAIAHLVEFLSIMILKEYPDSTFSHVINFYTISIFLIIIGAELFLRRRDNGSRALVWFVGAGISSLLVFSGLIFSGKFIPSLEPESALPGIYFSIVSASFVLGFIKIWRIRKLVSIVRGFCNYLLGSLFLIFVATLPNIFYEFIEEAMAVPEYQLVYVSHFTFYAALSIMFLAFGQVANLGGVYAAIKKD